MVVRADWRQEILRACRLAIPLLVTVLALMGIVRVVAFRKAYAIGLSVSECVSLARGMGRLEALAAPFILAAAWVVVYLALLGLCWAARGGGWRKTWGKAVRSARATRAGASRRASSTPHAGGRAAGEGRLTGADPRRGAGAGAGPDLEEESEERHRQEYPRDQDVDGVLHPLAPRSPVEPAGRVGRAVADLGVRFRPTSRRG